MSHVEHLLVAEEGTDDRSLYVIMAGVRVDDPEAAAERLTEAEDNRVLEVLHQVAFEIRIAFAAKPRLEALGEDWRYVFMSNLTEHGFDPNRRRAKGYPLVAHLPEGLPFDFTWLDAYLTNTSFGRAHVRTKRVAQAERVLLLPRLVARIFHDAIEEDVARPGAARERYNALAPLVRHIEDVGLNVSYAHGGTTLDALVRNTLSS